MTFIQAEHAYFDGRNSPRWIVIHDMEYPKRVGAAEWCARYFAGPGAPQKSAHYCIDPATIVQSVQEQNGAWHTTGFIGGLEINRNSIGIEHAGYANQTEAQWLDADGSAELKQSARLVADIARRYNIPIRHLTVDQIRRGEPGIAGHIDFNRASGSGDHTDPGPGFPWSWYINQVEAGGSSSKAARLITALLITGGIGLGAWVLMNPADARIFVRKLIPG